MTPIASGVSFMPVLRLYPTHPRMGRLCGFGTARSFAALRRLDDGGVPSNRLILRTGPKRPSNSGAGILHASRLVVRPRERVVGEDVVSIDGRGLRQAYGFL